MNSKRIRFIVPIVVIAASASWWVFGRSPSERDGLTASGTVEAVEAAGFASCHGGCERHEGGDEYAEVEAPQHDSSG